MQDNVQLLLHNGLIRPSHSPWASPVVLVPKAGSGGKQLRMCIDYRKLNTQTKKDAYPIPLIDDCLTMCKDADWITTLDVKDAYHHVPMHADSRPYTAFVTPDGLFEWLVMPFGLCNAPATFQRHIDSVLRKYVGKNVAAYFDDVIIYTKGSLADHLKAVGQVLDTLTEAKLQVKAEKCQFAVKEAKILGHIISKGKIMPDPEKVRSIVEYPKPQNLSQLRAFLGLANYYRQFITHFSHKASPLYELTRKDVPFEWTPARTQAFEDLKVALTTAPCLRPPDFHRPFILQTDASNIGISAILTQIDPDSGDEHPIAFKSRQLTPAEKGYSAVELECLAVCWGVKQYEIYLMDEPFTVVTDHYALRWLPTNAHTNKRLTRWALTLQALKYTVVHRAGTANANADALSRAPVGEAVPMSDEDEEIILQPLPKVEPKPLPLPRLKPAKRTIVKKTQLPMPTVLSTANRTVTSHVHPSRSLQITTTVEPAPLPTNSDLRQFLLIDSDSIIKLVEEQKNDLETGPLYALVDRGELPGAYEPAIRQQLIKKSASYSIEPDTKALQFHFATARSGPQDLHIFRPRLVLPLSFRKPVFELLHESPFGGHLGITRTYRKIVMSYYWTGMVRDIQRYVSQCSICAEYKLLRRTTATLPTHVYEAYAPLDIMSMDFMDLPQSADFKFGLLFVDHFTRFAIMVPTQNKKAETVAAAIIQDVVTRVGTPLQLHSDNGSEFHNNIMSTLASRMKVRVTFSPPYRPQSNGIVERTVSTLKSIIKTQITENTHSWMQVAHACVFAHNTAVHESTGFTPFFLMFGRESRIPFQPLPLPDQSPLANPRDDWVDELLTTQQSAYTIVRSALEDKHQKRDELVADHPPTTFYQVGDYVYLKSTPFLHPGTHPSNKGSKLVKVYSGPYRVISRLGNSVYTIGLAKLNPHSKKSTELKRVETVHISRLKPYTQPLPPHLLNTPVVVDPRESPIISPNEQNHTPMDTDEHKESPPPPTSDIPLLEEEFSPLSLPTSPLERTPSTSLLPISQRSRREVPSTSSARRLAHRARVRHFTTQHQQASSALTTPISIPSSPPVIEPITTSRRSSRSNTQPPLGTYNVAAHSRLMQRPTIGSEVHVHQSQPVRH